MATKKLLVTELPEGATPESVKAAIQRKYDVRVLEVGPVSRKGSITSLQAVYVPADDLSDPAAATTFAQLNQNGSNSE
ncbi:hypothetical protein AWU82_28550 [Pseudomonas glycinae]|uniref:Uncharacterized protein n=1 Tax=Pseudomonas glycinae TaxID=1785145 RepID=A0ABM6QHJ2_9PSED|nr:hypothetical protein [Pseudomonas glycinae]AUG97428.1 hypothetical protein AWU82_28550 [Pseudomonas glycinae]NKF28378.1 hypothetical protein [Pseudomonas sp. BG5]